MIEDLKEAHIQDLSEALDPHYFPGQLRDIMMRFGAEAIADNEYQTTGIAIKEFLRYMNRRNDEQNLRSATAYLVENTQGISDRSLCQIESALEGSRYVVERDEDGELELMLRISSEAERTIEDLNSYIEARAPIDVVEKIEEAHRRLTEGFPGEAVNRSRKALQKMSEVEYHEALDELVSKELIRQGKGNYIGEREMLYTPYGFCSEVESHIGPDENDPNGIQAETALRLTEEAIHYILRLQEKAEKEGIVLAKWEKRN